MKKICLTVLSSLFLLLSYAAGPEEVSEKVLEAFKESFTDIKNAQWYADGNTYTVRFVKNEIDTRITYDESAKITKTMRYYKGNHLPAYILGKLAEKYEDASVFGVTESNTAEGLTYYVTLQNTKNWMVVIGDASGNFRLDKKFKKAE